MVLARLRGVRLRRVWVLLAVRRGNGFDLYGASGIFLHLYVGALAFDAFDEVGIAVGDILGAIPGEDLVISGGDSA